MKSDFKFLAVLFAFVTAFACVGYAVKFASLLDGQSLSAMIHERIAALRVLAPASETKLETPASTTTPVPKANTLPAAAVRNAANAYSLRPAPPAANAETTAIVPTVPPAVVLAQKPPVAVAAPPASVVTSQNTSSPVQGEGAQKAAHEIAPPIAPALAPATPSATSAATATPTTGAATSALAASVPEPPASALAVVLPKPAESSTALNAATPASPAVPVDATARPPVAVGQAAAAQLAAGAPEPAAAPSVETDAALAERAAILMHNASATATAIMSGKSVPSSDPDESMTPPEPSDSLATADTTKAPVVEIADARETMAVPDVASAAAPVVVAANTPPATASDATDEENIVPPEPADVPTHAAAGTAPTVRSGPVQAGNAGHKRVAAGRSQGLGHRLTKVRLFLGSQIVTVQVPDRHFSGFLGR